jgi:hypothetical protein
MPYVVIPWQVNELDTRMDYSTITMVIDKKKKSVQEYRNPRQAMVAHGISNKQINHHSMKTRHQ